MSVLGMAGVGIASNVIGNKIGMGMQLSQQKRLQQLQLEGNMKMGKFNNEMAMQMWRDTNYSAQRREMEKAGLNVGLMYGGSGQGGQTNITSGNVSGGNAELPNNMQGMGMMLQAQATQSQIEVNKAQAEKIKAETLEVGARTPTYAKGMEKTDSEIQEIASRIGVNAEQVKKIMQEITESQSKTDLNKANLPKIEAEIKNISADTNKKDAEINRIKTLTPAELKNIKADTYEKLESVAQNWKKISIEERRNEIEQFKAEIKARYPSIGEAGGRVINTTINSLLALFGLAEEENKANYKID